MSEAETREDALTLVIQRARIRHAKAVETLSNEVEEMDEFGRTLDRAIAERVAAEFEVWER